MTTIPRFAVAVAGATVVGAMILTAPVANAIPEKTIKSECAQANGAYSTYVAPDGTRYSWCCYNDIAGGPAQCDAYENGTFTGTDARKAPPSGPVTGGNPPANNAPITNPPPAAH
jgi:hypothetical protein